MNPAGKAILRTSPVQAVPEAPGADAHFPDVLFLFGDGLAVCKEDCKDSLQRTCKAHGVDREFVTTETSEGRTIYDMLDERHAQDRIRPSTAIVIIMHGTTASGHHMMQFSRDQAMVSTMALLTHIAQLDGGNPEVAPQRRCVMHACSVNVITQALKETDGNYDLIGGKDVNLLEPAMDAIAEMLRQMGLAKEKPQPAGAGRQARRSSRAADLDAGYDPKSKPAHQASHWFTQADHASRLGTLLQDVHAASRL